jgi:hypothetical protein
MNSMLRSSELGQGSTPPRSGGSGDDGIKLTPESDDAARPISMLLQCRLCSGLDNIELNWIWIDLRNAGHKAPTYRQIDSIFKVILYR